jgi:phospholipase C
MSPSAPFDLRQIQTVVVVMMENRSFDHVFGHLTLPPFGNRTDVMGLDPAHWATYANPVAGERPHMPFAIRQDLALPHDLPHERGPVATQLAGGQMNGFVEAYYADAKLRAIDHPAPMGFFVPELVPTSAFLAKSFCVCDHWFAPLPASTMPNRLMALAGDAHTDGTGGLVVDPGPLVIDWLTARNVSWRVYHDGLFSFFTLFLRPEVLGPNFRRFTTLAADLAANDVPQVVFIEPTYHDAPHLHANDNHAPLPIGAGEHFLRDVYDVLSRSPQWANMLVVFTHDEHGGFFDHVAPPAIPYAPPANATYAAGFDTTGPRVPAIVASPFVTRKAFGEVLDHTSILQFLAERFDPAGGGYSPSVNARKELGVRSLSALLADREGGAAAPAPPAPTETPIRIETLLGAVPSTPLAEAFGQAGRHYMTNLTDAARAALPELWHLLR